MKRISRKRKRGIMRLGPRYRTEDAAARDRRRLGGAPFTVVANDCWGGQVYRYLGRPYNTPFVGLYLHGPCFARLASDLRGHLSSPLSFQRTSRYLDPPGYPVGVLAGDIEIHFMHYDSDDDARASWQRRVERVDWSAVRVKFAVGKDGISPEHVDAVRRAHPGALVLGPPGAPRDVVRVRDHTDDGAKVFRPSLRHFDLVAWLATGRVRPPRRYQRLR